MVVTDRLIGTFHLFVFVIASRHITHERTCLFSSPWRQRQRQRHRHYHQHNLQQHQNTNINGKSNHINCDRDHGRKVSFGNANHQNNASKSSCSRVCFPNVVCIFLGSDLMDVALRKRLRYKHNEPFLQQHGEWRERGVPSQRCERSCRIWVEHSTCTETCWPGA